MATGESLNLLVFAYCVRCLLEYRVEHEDSWVWKAALVFGLGAANYWLMLALLPSFGLNHEHRRTPGVVAARLLVIARMRTFAITSR